MLCQFYNIRRSVDTVGLMPAAAFLLILSSRSHRVCLLSMYPLPLNSVQLLWLCCAVLWLVGSCVPQLLIDLSEYVNVTSPAAPALAQTQRQPPKPPPVRTRAPAAELVSAQTDQLDRPVRTRVASSMSAWSLTGRVLFVVLGPSFIFIFSEKCLKSITEDVMRKVEVKKNNNSQKWCFYHLIDFL